jgi:hypothetical protein
VDPIPLVKTTPQILHVSDFIISVMAVQVCRARWSIHRVSDEPAELRPAEAAGTMV